MGILEHEGIRVQPQVERYVLKPVAQGYDFIIPDFVQVGISNIFYNLRFPQRILEQCVSRERSKAPGLRSDGFS